MIKAIVLYPFLFPALAFAQFPAPESFAITVNYILDGQWDWCDNHVIDGPAYCNLFSWEAPDTANTPATLTGYRIYKDSTFFLATANTMADTSGGYMASFYVSAVYENPSGESEPSNIVVIGDLPMATGETHENNQIRIGFDLANRMLLIQGAEYARSLRVYDMRGVLIMSTEAVSENLRLEGLAAGVYGVVLRSKDGNFRSKMLDTGF